MAHIHGHPDNEQGHLDDLLGRGKGDPDTKGYQGQTQPPLELTRSQELELAKRLIEQFAPKGQL